MATTIDNAIPRAYAANSQTTQYTANNCKAQITKFTVTNVTSSNATYAVNLVASGDTATNANRVLQTKTIAPSETYNCPELVGQVLRAGGFISTIAGTGSALVHSCSVIEYT